MTIRFATPDGAWQVEAVGDRLRVSHDGTEVGAVGAGPAGNPLDGCAQLALGRLGVPAGDLVPVEPTAPDDPPGLPRTTGEPVTCWACGAATPIVRRADGYWYDVGGITRHTCETGGNHR